MASCSRHEFPDCGRPIAAQATWRCFQATDLDLAKAKATRPARTRRQRKQRLRCAACGYAVTDEGQRIAMAGSHAHRFTNPVGYVYEIGCFRAAPGCGHVGEFIAEHTWFAGYSWQIAVCGGCGEHLGWRYRGAEAGMFYGLITGRLVSEQ